MRILQPYTAAARVRLGCRSLFRSDAIRVSWVMLQAAVRKRGRGAASWDSCSSTTRSSCCWVLSWHRQHAFPPTWYRASAPCGTPSLASCSTSSTWRGCSKTTSSPAPTRGWRGVRGGHVAGARGDGRRVPHVVLAFGMRLPGRGAQAFKVAPAVLFVAASVAVLALLPEGDLRSFLFYFPRELYLFWMLLFAGFRLLVSEGRVRRNRLRRHRLALRGAVVVGLMIVAEDVCVFLLPDPSARAARLCTRAQLRRERAHAVLRVLRVPRCLPRAVAALRAASHARGRPAGGAHRRQPASCTASATSCPSASARCCATCWWARTTRTSRPLCIWPEHREGARAQHPSENGQANRQALVQDFWKMS